MLLHGCGNHSHHSPFLRIIIISIDKGDNYYYQNNDNDYYHDEDDDEGHHD